MATVGACIIGLLRTTLILLAVPDTLNHLFPAPPTPSAGYCFPTQTGATSPLTTVITPPIHSALNWNPLPARQDWCLLLSGAILPDAPFRGTAPTGLSGSRVMTGTAMFTPCISFTPGRTGLSSPGAVNCWRPLRLILI